MCNIVPPLCGIQWYQIPIRSGIPVAREYDTRFRYLLPLFSGCRAAQSLLRLVGYPTLEARSPGWWSASRPRILGLGSIDSKASEETRARSRWTLRTLRSPQAQHLEIFLVWYAGIERILVNLFGSDLNHGLLVLVFHDIGAWRRHHLRWRPWHRGK